jgi:TonB family protein
MTGLAACGGQDTAKDEETIPKDVPGLEIQGPRTKANVIANMEPAVRTMRKIYEKHRERNPALEGRIELKLSVDWNGEIMQIEVGRSTMNDPAFEKEVVRPLQFMDFDAWSTAEEDTDIVYPVEFEI